MPTALVHAWQSWRRDRGTLVLAVFALVVGIAVTEAVSAAGDEFGEDRLRAVLQRIRDQPVDEIVRQLAAAIDEWAAGAVQHDDITFVVLKGI